MTTNTLKHFKPERKEETRLSVIVFSIFLLGFLLRPSIFQGYGEVIFAAFVGSIGFYALIGLKGYVSTRRVAFVISVILFSGYITIQAAVMGVGEIGPLLKNIAFILLPSFAVFLLSSQTWPSALKVIVYTVGLFIPSYLVSTILLLLGYELNQVSYFQFVVPMGEKEYEMFLTLPFSVYISSLAELGPVELPRAVGIFREPGLFQILTVMTFFGVDFVNVRFKQLLRWGSLFVLLLTFSTAGWGVFIICWAYYYLIAKRGGHGLSIKRFGAQIGTTMVLVGLVYFFLFAESKASLLTKLQSGSGQVRILALLQSIEIFASNPIFGVGYGNSDVDTVLFIGTMAQIGTVGLVLVLAMIFGPNLDLVLRRHPVVVLMIPVLVTSLLSQPIFDKSIFVLIVGMVTAYPYRQVEYDRFWSQARNHT